MVFLESAGRPTVMADGTPRSATGLAQIIPSTATDLLGMRVDLERSLALTRKIAQAANRGRPELAEQRSRERAEVDQRSWRSRGPRGTCRSPRRGSAPKSWRWSRTTWGSATSRA